MATERIRVGVIGANVRNGWGRDAHIPALSAKRESHASKILRRGEKGRRHHGSTGKQRPDIRDRRL